MPHSITTSTIDGHPHKPRRPVIPPLTSRQALSLTPFSCKEKTVHADAGYTGAEKRAPKRGRKWHIAAKRGAIKAMPESELKDAIKHTEHMKAAVRSKVEHPFRVVKRQFGFQKVRFKGLVKNTAQILTLFALSNLWMARRTLMMAGEVRP